VVRLVALEKPAAHDPGIEMLCFSLRPL
jgi:hypothetical protein